MTVTKNPVLRVLFVATLIGVGLVLFGVPAFAQQVADDGKVVVPFGAWLSAAASWTAIVLVAGAGFAFRRLPKAAQDAAEMVARLAFQKSVNELLEKAVQYGINATAGAMKDKALTIDVGNRVVEKALEYAFEHAPQLVTKLGGLTRLREKIIARLNLDEAAASDKVAVNIAG